MPDKRSWHSGHGHGSRRPDRREDHGGDSEYTYEYLEDEESEQEDEPRQVRPAPPAASAAPDGSSVWMGHTGPLRLRGRRVRRRFHARCRGSRLLLLHQRRGRKRRRKRRRRTPRRSTSPRRTKRAVAVTPTTGVAGQQAAALLRSGPQGVAGHRAAAMATGSHGRRRDPR